MTDGVSGPGDGPPPDGSGDGGAGAPPERGGALARPGGAAPARRFSDEEVARILRAASEMQERSDAPGAGPRGGLSLEDLRQVAREVGIDPRFVEVAADRLHGPPEREGSALAGGAYAWVFHRTVEGEVPEADRDRIVRAIRAVVGQKGEVEDVYGRMEWSYDDGLGPLIVGLSSREGRTEIDVSARRVSEAGLLHGLGIPFIGGFGGAAVGSGLLALSPAGVLSLVGIGSLAAFGGIRTAWSFMARRWERKLERLAEAVAKAAAEVAVVPEAGEGGEGGAPALPGGGGPPATSAGPPPPPEV